MNPNLYVFDLHIFRVSRRDSFCCSRNLKQLSPEHVQIFQVQLLKKFCLVYFDMDKFFDIIAVFLRLISNLSLETFFALKLRFFMILHTLRSWRKIMERAYIASKN